MKTFLSAQLAAHYLLPTTTIARCWKVTRMDGEVFGFTTHNRSITFLGLRYLASSGFTPSMMASSAQMNVDNMEVNALIDSDVISVADLEAGRWDGAAYEIFEVNWNDLTMGRNLLSAGWLGQAKRTKGLFIAELRGLASKLNQNVGRIILPTCHYKLGAPGCDVDLTPFIQSDVPVTAVTSRLVFSAEFGSPAFADDWFNWGWMTFTTGPNAGITRDVKSSTMAGEITLQMAYPFVITPGDEFEITPGCNKLFKTAPGEYLGDCIVKFDNGVNFPGHPEVPMVSETVRDPAAP